MRRGELLALRWEYVDLKRRVLHLPETKNGTSRNVPLSTKAVAVLEALPRNMSGRVFDTSETAITEGFQRAAKRGASSISDSTISATRPPAGWPRSCRCTNWER